MINLNDICKSYGGRTVLSDLSLSVGRGERVCLTGPSGCGKSTLLAIAAGVLEPDSGEVSIKEDARKAFLYQENRLLPWLDALENITVAGVPADRAMEMLDKMGIAADAHKRPAQLSGGMCRRLAIARVLAFGGDIYYLDEPMQGLDADTAGRVMQVMQDELHGKTALIVSHIEEEISALGTRTVALPAREKTE